jgi:hypothetical protein
VNWIKKKLRQFRQRSYWFVQRQAPPWNPDLYAVGIERRRWFWRVGSAIITRDLAWMNARAIAENNNKAESDAA